MHGGDCAGRAVEPKLRRKMKQIETMALQVIVGKVTKTTETPYTTSAKPKHKNKYCVPEEFEGKRGF